jgi:hypothetical protein
MIRLIIYILEHPDWDEEIIDMGHKSNSQELDKLALTHLLIREALNKRFEMNSSNIVTFNHLFNDDIIELYTDLDCSDLAVEISKLTKRPVYGLYNLYESINQSIYGGGHNYIHYLVKLKGRLFVDITGINNLITLNERWCTYVHRENPDAKCKIEVESADELMDDDYCVNSIETKKIAKIIVDNINNYL